MYTTVKLYSKKIGELNKFLSKFYDTNLEIEDALEWKKEFNNPIEMAEIIGTFIDNKDKFQISMWINLDSDLFINVTEANVDKIIKYLYERYPY